MENNNDSGLLTFIINCRRIYSCYKFSFLELLAVKFNFFHRFMMNMRKAVFLNEIKMAKITSKDNVLLIGCGIFPTEIVLIAQQTGAKVVGIDNSKKAVQLANKYVNKKRLSNLIKIKYADGINCPIKDFDVIFIAINVFPIDFVLENLSKNMKSSARIICKSMKKDIAKMLEKKGLSNTFIIESELKNPKTRSFLLTKK